MLKPPLETDQEEETHKEEDSTGSAKETSLYNVIHGWEISQEEKTCKDEDITGCGRQEIIRDDDSPYNPEIIDEEAYGIMRAPRSHDSEGFVIDFDANIDWVIARYHYYIDAHSMDDVINHGDWLTTISCLEKELTDLVFDVEKKTKATNEIYQAGIVQPVSVQCGNKVAVVEGIHYLHHVGKVLDVSKHHVKLEIDGKAVEKRFPKSDIIMYDENYFLPLQVPEYTEEHFKRMRTSEFSCVSFDWCYKGKISFIIGRFNLIIGTHATDGKISDGQFRQAMFHFKKDILKFVFDSSVY